MVYTFKVLFVYAAAVERTSRPSPCEIDIMDLMDLRVGSKYFPVGSVFYRSSLDLNNGNMVCRVCNSSLVIVVLKKIYGCA